MKLETKDDWFDVEFYNLYDAVKDDNVSVVERMLARNPKLKFEILNGGFQLPPLEYGPFSEDVEYCMTFNINRMWHLAAYFSAFKTLSLFMKENVNYFQVDDDGHNVFHILAMGGYFCPYHEELKVKPSYLFLCDNLSTDVVRALHMETNKRGLRPVELAATLGTMHLFKEMMLTNGVYHSCCQSYGMYEIHWYDITEYEQDRTAMSPLAGLMTLEGHKVSDAIVHDVYESVVLQHWVKMKKNSLRNFLGISLIGRLLYAIMFLLFMLGKCSIEYDSIDKFVASKVCPAMMFPSWFIHAMQGGLCLGSLIHIFIDAVEMYLFRSSNKCNWFFRNPKGWKDPAVGFSYYRIIDGIMAVTTLIYILTSMLLMHKNFTTLVTLIQLTYAIALITICWSMLHFLQLHSHVGVFIMCIQRMFTDLTHFLIVFVLFCVPFVYSFSSIVYEGLAYSNVTDDSAFSANPYFTSFWKSHYTVFTIILNMVNFDNIGIANNNALYILHALFVVIVVILLMNMLIAKFSSSVAVVTENRKVLLTIQNLAIMWSFEFRYKWLLPCWLYKKLRRDTFPSMDGRLYIRDILIRACHAKPKVNETNV